MKQVNCQYFEVTCSDGGGMHSIVVAKFTKYSDAALVAARLTKEKKWPYTAHTKPKVVEINMFESADEYSTAIDTISIRKAALAKLTDVERKALGIEEH